MTIDEDLDRMLDERTIGHLDFEPKCELRLAVLVRGQYAPRVEGDCEHAAIGYVECRTCKGSVNVCAEHLAEVMRNPTVHCFGCGSDDAPLLLLRVVRFGGAS